MKHEPSLHTNHLGGLTSGAVQTQVGIVCTPNPFSTHPCMGNPVGNDG